MIKDAVTKVTVLPYQYHFTNAPYPSLALFLSEEEAGEAWGLSSKAVLLRLSGRALDRNVLSHCFYNP
jgi:hypothetical protein